MVSKRITLVADELLGFAGAGGIGTSTSHLALGLARLGHRVELLYFGAPGALEPGWARTYAEHDIAIRPIGPDAGLPIEPPYFRNPHAVDLALRDDPPDVVVAQDLAAPAYVSLRLRQLGLAFAETLFVVFCHGTRRWITDVRRKVRVLPGAHGVTLLEQAAVELADVVVSPCAYMVGWMRDQGWRLLEPRVIPYLTASAATGEEPPRVDERPRGIERLAFFGRLDPRKGTHLFLAALDRLDPDLLERVDLVFVGRPAPLTPDAIEAALSPKCRASLRSLAFEPGLGREEALALVARPGTLAVMPSLTDNSPNTVYECLDRRIPFIASDAGGTGELVAEADRERTLFEPTVEALESALRRALTAERIEPSRPGFDATASLDEWADVILQEPQSPRGVADTPAVDVVVAPRDSRSSRCLTRLRRQRFSNFRVIVVTGQAQIVEDRHDEASPTFVASDAENVVSLLRAGAAQGDAPWVVFLEDDDEPDEAFLDTLVRAQVASEADVVTCAVSIRTESGPPATHFFHGEPGGLAALGNGYGTAALLRRTLLEDGSGSSAADNDSDWSLFARLNRNGARIVSVPIPLLARARLPGTADADPVDALVALEELERGLPDPFRSLARLAAGLAVTSESR